MSTIHVGNREIPGGYYIDPTPGSDIKDACHDAAFLAMMTDMKVWLDFNGVKLVCFPGQSSRDLIDLYHYRNLSRSNLYAK